ncbi:alpha/beta-hydrolase [Wallemia mellicola CBS 633.66]|uniref:Alpha/beta-hydrolase n=2 Tax=Wallemia mellicola TaxID=1708541 RepID=A0A4T0QEP1_9BASI|nr:alpha/beta-hydrolase [Wallemia mellicola CBS 633.66]TIB79394.1 hypothetical protein E3Q23_00221 [Wallemia mellicola]EIM24059.1 alpha/beta-hydrolase [Wallemia mellicola CBS 633.66]TIB88366.1 alpha/beta-hydrolase [Wallemia mellicola]TIB91105.1 alpha/beta-hydrolase [Wallemia mellicola]TIB94703.1 alpha/beta-hydrolase [Wallemia mellicola]|eukprot:XP_006955888.1 alpha/beta-hydrolase [Wallemia mellicola CBS 633.66]
MVDAIPEAVLEVPRTLKESFKAWWSYTDDDGLKSQERMFAKLPFDKVNKEDLPSIDTPKRVAYTSLVDINHPSFDNPVKINTLEIGSYPKPNPAEEIPIVCSHGYAAATFFFLNNLHALGNIPKTRFYGMDVLGMGLSERVKFPHINTSQPVEKRVGQAEDFFTDALEAWRKAQGINKMILIGHSLGGYISTVYALKYPEHVKKLILVSPIGFPKNPESVRAESLNKDLAQAESQSRTHEFSDMPETRTRKALKSVIRYLWEDRNFSPFDILRKSFFFGPMLVSSYSLRRFSTLSDDLQRDLYHYIYSISVRKASSEYSITHLLSFGAYARLPLIDRIEKLDKRIPVTFMHGSVDWVDGGEAAFEKMKNLGFDVKYEETPRSGHHLYLDNPEDFNRFIVKDIESCI